MPKPCTDILYALDSAKTRPENAEQLYGLEMLDNKFIRVQLAQQNIGRAYSQNPYTLRTFKQKYEGELFMQSCMMRSKPLRQVHKHFRDHMDSLPLKLILAPDNDLFVTDMLCEKDDKGVHLFAYHFNCRQNVPAKFVTFNNVNSKTVHNIEDYETFYDAIPFVDGYENNNPISDIVAAITDLQRQAVFDFAQKNQLPTFSFNTNKLQHMFLTRPEDRIVSTSSAKRHMRDALNTAIIYKKAIEGKTYFMDKTEANNFASNLNDGYFPHLAKDMEYRNDQLRRFKLKY